MKSTWKPTITLLASLAVMIPWPLIGIALTHSLFDQASETALLFGGVTGLILAPLTSLFEFSETAFLAGVLAVWCSALILPPLIVLRLRSSRTVIAVLLSCQSAFSLAQAALGALMIVGKSV